MKESFQLQLTKGEMILIDFLIDTAMEEVAFAPENIFTPEYLKNLKSVSKKLAKINWLSKVT